MEDVNATTSRSLIILLVLLLVTVNVNGDFLVSGDDNGTVQIVSLNKSQYCFVDNSTIRINFNTTVLLNIIDSNEDLITAAVAEGDINNTVIFTAPVNGSKCTDDNSDHNNKLSTTLYVIQMIIYSITLLAAIANITLHLLVKDLHTLSGTLIILLCVSVIIITFIAMGSLTNAYINEVITICVVLINTIFIMLFVYQATKLTFLYHFAYLMYHSYKLISKKENTKRKLYKYIAFIFGSSTFCFLLALVVDTAISGTVSNNMERYCLNSEYSFILMMLVYGELSIFVILEYATFAVGLTLYFLVSKNCCAMKSTNFRVTMALTATVGINIVLLVSLNKARVPVNILIPAVTISTLTEQVILLALFLSSNKVLSAYRNAYGSDAQMQKTTPQSNMIV